MTRDEVKMGSMGRINARLNELGEALVFYDKKFGILKYEKVSIELGCIEHHVVQLRARMTRAMRQGSDSLETIAGFIETMLLVVQKYDLEHPDEDSGIVIQLDDIRQKVSNEHQELIKQGWKMVVGF